MEMIVAQLPEVSAQQDREIEWLAGVLALIVCMKKNSMAIYSLYIFYLYLEKQK